MHDTRAKDPKSEIRNPKSEIRNEQSELDEAKSINRKGRKD
jgi:hypothetical protein